MTSGGWGAWFVVLQGYDAHERDDAGRREYGYVCMAAETICFSMTNVEDAPGREGNKFNMYKFVVCQTGCGWSPSHYLRPWRLGDIAPDGGRSEEGGSYIERRGDVAEAGNGTGYCSVALSSALVDGLGVNDLRDVPSSAAVLDRGGRQSAAALMTEAGAQPLLREACARLSLREAMRDAVDDDWSIARNPSYDWPARYPG